jgi:hypothetical protein
MILAPTLLLNAGSGAAIARPTFSRDFAGEKTLNNGTGPAITFTRASGATYFDADGVLQTAANDAPRFDHDPATGASRGLLIEEARTNSATYSEDFSNAAWVKTGGRVVITTNQIVAPDGNLTADFAEANGGASNSRLIQQTDVASSAGKTLSVFAKAGTASFLQLLFGTDTAPWANFDLSAGAVGSTGTVLSATITPVGNGWYRCQVATSSTTATNATFALVSSSTAARASSNTLSTGLYVWGAQLEAGAFPTSYIPTTTAAATRAADSAIVTPISSFYNQAEVTLFVENTFSAMSSSSFAVAFDNDTVGGGGSGNELRLWKWENNDNLYASITDSDNLVAQAGTTTPVTTSTVCKYGLAMAVNNFAASFFGSAAATDTNCAMPTVSHLRIGQGVVLGTRFLNGHIRKVACWPKRLSNTLLQQLTT